MDPLNHDTVIARYIPDSFAKKSLGSEGETIDLNLARAQHQAYLDAIESTGVRVIVLPANETMPDCVFVEDVAVVIGNTALITRPGDPSRALETSRPKDLLISLGFKIAQIRDRNAKLDGGDVIYTGHEILIAQSLRTNQAGIEAVRETFPELNVVQITAHGPLHLTTLVGLVSNDVLCISKETEHSMKMFDQIQTGSTRTYKKIEVSKDNAANCIVMNGHLICKSSKENPEDAEVLAEENVGMPIKGLEISELEKAVGSLSCMSLRFQMPK